LAVPQCGQVIMESSITELPSCRSRPAPRLISPAVETEREERDAEEKHRQQHVVHLGEPGREPDRAQREYEQRRKAADRGERRADGTGRDQRVAAPSVRVLASS